MKQMSKGAISWIVAMLVVCANLHAQSVPSYVPNNGLVAYYGFSGNSNDYSGNGNHGTLGSSTYSSDLNVQPSNVGANNPTLTSDRFGNTQSAYEFHGQFVGGTTTSTGARWTASWIKIPGNNLPFSNTLSISCWFKISQFSGMNGTMNNDAQGTFSIIDRGVYGQNHSDMTEGYGFGVYCDRDASSILTIRTTNNKQNISTYDLNNSSILRCFSPNEWVHYVIVITPDSVASYLNGRKYLQLRQTTSFNLQNLSNLPIYIGVRNAGQFNLYPFKGAIDDIAIYNRKLTDADVKMLYNDYVNPISNSLNIQMDRVDVTNPCGTTLGSITLTPRMISGVTYKYSITNENDLQTSNTFQVGPGTYHCYVVTDCRTWDTTIVLECNCDNDPSLTTYHQVCEGATQTSGSPNEQLCNYTFESGTQGWSIKSGGHWEVENKDRFYYIISQDRPVFYPYSGSRAFYCPTLQSSQFTRSTSNIISPAISIPMPITSQPILTFAYFSAGLLVNATPHYNTLKIYISTSPNGTWTNIWTQPQGNVATWQTDMVSLANYITTAGTYYFRIECSGDGYCAGIDDFKITANTYMTIPAEVVQAQAGSTVRTEDTVTSASGGACPVSVITYWNIIPNANTDEPAGCDSLFFNGQWYYENTTTVEHLIAKTRPTIGNPSQCDSTATHNIKIYKSELRITDTTVCDSFVWYANPNYVYRAGTDDMIHRTNALNCESNDSLHLVLGHSFSHSIQKEVSSNNLPYFCEFDNQYYDYELRHHRIQYTTAEGCDSSYYLSLTIIRELPECDKYLEFPNIVTPNADNRNDIFVIAGISRECYEHCRLSIYNRWGACVYKTTDLDELLEGWDPSNMPGGTYYYHFEAHSHTAKVSRNGVMEIVK
ncbi:MAG: gliding motility-associated C-terminal domain-containing protein [Bacteroidales bacterium]|nr:gliding motility-associated C-terminal domain-containing protein [Candidatus Colimorpha onthohippi]